MAPDDVVEDLADVLGLVERGYDGADRLRPDLVPALDQLDELVDDRARGRDLLVIALDRQLVPAQAQRAMKPPAQSVEHAVADARELRGDLVRDGRTSCTRLSVEQGSPRTCDGEARVKTDAASSEVAQLGQKCRRTRWLDVDELER